MKIRTGFVSNSSSSSFLIAFKPHSKDHDDPIFDSCLIKNGVDPESPFFGMIEDALVAMWYDAHKTRNWRDWLEDRGEYYKDEPENETAMWSSNDGDEINVKKLLDQGWIVGIGECDSGEGELRHLYNLSLHFKSDNLIIEKVGGH